MLSEMTLEHRRLEAQVRRDERRRSARRAATSRCRWGAFGTARGAGRDGRVDRLRCGLVHDRRILQPHGRHECLLLTRRAGHARRSCARNSERSRGARSASWSSHVLHEADRRGIHVAVALTDRWGRRLAFQRQPGTVIACSAIAIGKALAACTFDAPTHAARGDDLAPTTARSSAARTGLRFVGGGFPVRAGGLLVGGIGVSGASAAGGPRTRARRARRRWLRCPIREPAKEDGGDG